MQENFSGVKNIAHIHGWWGKKQKYGFVLYNKSQPNYYYVIGNERKNRFNYRKSELVKKYNCPENMSEHEFCLAQKWYRIYDCGCLCYEWIPQK